MDYTFSNSFTTDPGTNQRLHEQAKAVPTAVSDTDMNGLIWELMEIIKAGGLSGAPFDKTNPATYQKLLTALRNSGVFQTPAQFDNSTKAATTAFVQQSIGNRKQAIVGLNGAANLIISQAGSLITLGGSGAYTVALPIPNFGGAAFEFINFGTAAVTLTTPSGYFNGSVSTPGAASIVVAAGASLTAICDGFNWLVNSGNAPSVLSNPGYVKLPSGLLIQFGIAVTNASGAAVFTLPIAFPNAPIIGFCQYQNAGLIAYAGASTGVISTTTATGYLATTSGSAVSGAPLNFLVFGK